MFFTIFLSDKLRPFLESELISSGRTIENHSAALGWLYLAAAFAQTIGMWLMRPTIHNQLHQYGPAGGTASFIGAIFLLVMHITIFGVLFIWDGFKYIWGNTSGIKIILPILFCMLPTITAIIISFPGKTRKQPTNTQYWLGWLGTILITFSMVVVAQSCWHILLDGMGKDLHSLSFLGNVLISLLFGFVFLLFYLPPRYAFLITDHNKPSTWFWILAVYTPFAYDIFSGH